MSFEEVSRQFAQSESGTDSFKILFRRAFELMQEDAPNAALYFVIGIAAQAYVRRYEDEGVTSDFANETKKTLEAFNAKILRGLQSDPATRLVLAGEVANEYEHRITTF
jgi:hypothetical protein